MLSPHRSFWMALACGLLLLCARPAGAQSNSDYDASWYSPDAPHLKINVTRDGVYRVAASSLQGALPDGTVLSDIPPATIRLIENGTEIPITVNGADDGSLDPSDTITFVGHRNRGDDELWAYNGDASAQSSVHRSLYSDTTHYWMTWGGEEGLRYERPSTDSPPPTTALSDTAHIEQDQRYYLGRSGNTGNPLYTESEGYYWRQFRHNPSDTAPISATYTLPVGRRTESNTSLNLQLRFDAETNSCHRVEIEGELRQPDGSRAFESLTTVEWENMSRTTAETTVTQDRVPDSGLTLRLTSYNNEFSDDTCTGGTSNFVLFDWAEAAYTRSLEAQNNQQRFVSPNAGTQTFALTAHAGDSVRVYNPTDGHRYTAPIENDTARVSASPATSRTPFWAVGDDGFHSPATVEPDTPSSWSVADAHGADYLLLTTEALLPAAQQLADYRRSHDGYQVEVALVQNVFDEFDYGRPTPIAIRRFVRAAQTWSPAPEFLAIFGDAQYPIRDGSVDTTYPAWSVPSFGYAPSDGWYAMQTDGSTDWSEVLAVGRIPVRSVPQGELFLEKLQTYEEAPLEQWQKRMLLLAGGTSPGEQDDLQGYSNWWGEIAADTVSNNPTYTGPVYTGADTLRYYKRSDSPLDDTFQDSLAVDLERGAGWLNYFGHAAAQTWEIVTEDPPEWDNAGRLPIVVSLSCRTGSFAGGQFEQKSVPSLGEQLVVGSVRADGTPEDGARNGSIAHFGESALGRIRSSAQLNDALIRRVFVDTVRVLGEAIRSAKAEFEANSGNKTPLLQYGLLGDPATHMALPERSDLHVSSNLISITPSAPVPSDQLTATVRLQNRGLIPTDSVTARFTWERPDGSTVRRTRRLDRFRLEKTLTFTFDLDERAIGTNAFRVRVDPENAHDEVRETNNVAERTQVVFDTGVSLLAPSDYGTVSSERPTLEFTISGQTTQQTPVTLQLDTVPDFSSPTRQEVRREVSGLRGTWQPSGLVPDQTYYWRARLTDADESTWQSSQFTIAPNFPEQSWLQRNRLFSTNAHTQLEYTGRSWAFDEYSRRVQLRSNFGDAQFRHGFKVGTADYEYLQFGFGILVMNGVTGEVRGSESFPTYDLRNDLEDDVGDQQEAIDALATFLDEVPREGDYVFIRTRHLARKSSSSIQGEVKTLFRNLGTSEIAEQPHSKAIDSLTYQNLWTLKTRKGYPEATVEQVRARSDTNQMGQIENPSFSYSSGTTLSPRIGPASEWSSLQWTGTAPDASDNISMEVLASDSTVLIENLRGASGAHDLSSIDANTHPYLRLRATFTDSTSRTAPQLEQWSVSHTGVPELVVDPSGLRTLPDTLRQGEQVSLSVPVVNFGPVASEPVRVQTAIEDASNTTTTLSADTLSALAPNGGRDTSSLAFASTDFPGANILTTEARADGPPERLPSNNTVVRNLYVDPDETPPSIRVLANGRELPSTPDDVGYQADRIPFVPTQPALEIRIQDDNPTLALDDTSHVDVYLKEGLPERDPGLNPQFRRVPFSSDALEFLPPDSGSTDPLQLRLEPELPFPDTTYTLKVEATDAQDNTMQPYQGSFRIQPNQVIKDVYPYPNPMRSHTTFAFRVEGGRSPPRKFRLRIYTLSGRLVRELDERHLELPLDVGWNKLRWNGRDEDGDRVATGTYLYRVRIEGQDTTFRGDVEKISVIR